MAEIKIYVDIGRIFFIENEDRNGPALSIDLANKQSLRQAINSLSNQDDEIIATGEFSRIERHSTNLFALFKIEAEADNYVADHPGTKKVIEISIDGFDFKVVTA